MLAADLDLGQAGDCLYSAEPLLGALPAALADRIAKMAKGASVDGGLAVLSDLGQMTAVGDMRPDFGFPQSLGEGLNIEQLVRPSVIRHEPST